MERTALEKEREKERIQESKEESMLNVEKKGEKMVAKDRRTTTSYILLNSADLSEGAETGELDMSSVRDLHNGDLIFINVSLKVCTFIYSYLFGKSRVKHFMYFLYRLLNIIAVIIITIKLFLLSYSSVLGL